MLWYVVKAAAAALVVAVGAMVADCTDLDCAGAVAGATSTLAAGLLALVAAIIAKRGIDRQIRSAVVIARLERLQREAELAAEIHDATESVATAFSAVAVPVAEAIA